VTPVGVVCARRCARLQCSRFRLAAAVGENALLLGVIADDFTGAHDVGAAFAAQGFAVAVLTRRARVADYVRDADILVLDTDSRGEEPASAYARAVAAAEALCAVRPRMHIYKKICSAFRGNVGAELDAVLDIVGVSSTVVVPAFPQIGRVTAGGVHHVRGVPLHETPFAAEVRALAGDSFLPGILQRQMRRTVGHLAGEAVRAGAEQARRALDALWVRHEVVVADAASESDLGIIARASEGLGVVAGSGGLARAIAAGLPDRRLAAHRRRQLPRVPRGPTLVVSGSLTAVAAEQMAMLLAQGVHGFALTETVIFRETGAAAATEALVTSASACLKREGVALFYLPSGVERLCALRQRAAAMGWTEARLKREVFAVLGRLAARIATEGGAGSLILAGGGTAAAVCEHLGIVATRLVRELDIGTALAVACGERPLGLVVKPGDFGTVDFHLRALQALRAEAEREEAST